MADAGVPWFRVDLGSHEIERVGGAITSRHVTMGPESEEMEHRLAGFLDVPEVVLVNSGASALLVALAACGVGPGDEVVVPALSFIATAHAPMLLGARVRLADVLPDRPLMDPDSLESVVTSRTRAIVPVHLNGRGADLDRIMSFARHRGIAVVEDAAQALGSRDAQGRSLGTRSDAGCFSFGITKLGWRVFKGVIAVDPRVIVMESEMYVPGYGLGIAGDTGGKIKGLHIDLYYPVDEMQLWYKWQDIYLLDPPPPSHQIRWILPNR